MQGYHTILFVMSMVDFGIQQHSELECDGYNMLIKTCLCFGAPKSVFHIMWVKSN